MFRRLRHTRLARHCIAAAVATAFLPMGAQATLESGTNDPEMFLVIWDQAREASYTLDLGLHVSTLRGNGQSDSGYQKFWTLDPATDSNLAALLTGGSAVGALQWGVMASDNDGFNFQEGDLWLFTTLQHTTASGTLNPNFAALQGQTNVVFEQAIQVVNNYAGWIKANASARNQINQPELTNFALNGSAFGLKGEIAYIDDTNNGGVQKFGGGGALGNGPSTLNTIGSSSWAYMATTSGFGTSTDPLLLDEFDNLEHDAYWGLVKDPDSDLLYLSYTLDAVGQTAAQREFALGIGRTEFGGGFNVRRLDGVAVATGIETPTGFARRLGAAEFAPAVVAVVPEPATTGLMALGLAVLGGLVRRRR